MDKYNLSKPIRLMTDGFYLGKRYNSDMYLLLLIFSIGLGLLTLTTNYGYYIDDHSMQGFGAVQSKNFFLAIYFSDLLEWFMYLLPGMSYSIFLLFILPKSKILDSYFATYLIIVIMYSVSFVLGHIFAMPNFITGAIFAGCIGLMMEEKYSKKWNIPLGIIGLITGFIGTVLVFAYFNQSDIPYAVCYIPWQIGVGLLLIYNYEEKEEELEREVLQIP